VEDSFEIAAKSFVTSIPISCLCARSVDNEVGYLKRFIARPLGHNAKMDWHAIWNDNDFDVLDDGAVVPHLRDGSVVSSLPSHE